MKNCEIIVGVSILIGIVSGQSISDIPKISLFKQKDYGGSSTTFMLYPGCNNIWAYGWDNAAASIALPRTLDCLILWQGVNCRGRSERITSANSTMLRDLDKLGFVHGFDDGVSAIEKCDSGICTAVGKFVYPGACDLYIVCTEDSGQIKKRVHRCPPKKKYDPKFGTCDFPEKIFPRPPC